MLAVLALVLAAASLGISLALAVRVRALTERPVLEERMVSAIEPGPLSPLAGRLVAIQIEQDHPHSLFAGLVKEALLLEDAEVVGEESAEIVVRGRIVCNGYADIYYEAEFACELGARPLCTLIERPPHGDRPGNLVLELIGRLKRELNKAVVRNERRDALRELQGD